jgi:GntR family histidine utilization transcriptional repressor
MSKLPYQLIKDYVLERIHNGLWKEGDVVPSENELSGEFQVARMTVNRALRELTAEQVLTRIQGKGTFVAQPKYQSTVVEIKNIADEIEGRRHRHHADVLAMETLTADADLAERMHLRRGDPVFHSRLLHFEDDAPIQLEERWVNPAVAGDYMEQDFTACTPNEYLMRVAPLQRVEYTLEARTPHPATRSALRMGGREPCLVLRRRTWSKGCVASAAVLWHPGNRYQFTGQF